MGDEQALNDLMAVTQQTLQPLISKPKLTEKLLGKPPFRFLHDIFTNLIKGTGFAEGLYAPEEMDSANIQDKQQKLDYLEKIITCVGICLGAPVDVRPSKIVAGLEPENTNMLLQALAQAASDPSVDSAAAVRRTLGGEKPGEGPAAKKATSRPPAAAAKEVEPAEEKVSTRRESLDSRRGSSGNLDAKGGPGPAPVTRGSSNKSMAAPLAGPTGPAKQLDAQIDACNSDMTRTKEMLEGLISRPKPNDKLLSKPPFRFLHDIVSEVMRTTGFGQGLYDETESDSTKVTEKNAKIVYLEKIIKLVGMQLNTIVDARPSKIVAGLEPENTNRFLQLLVLAATEMPDSARAVRLVLDPDGAQAVDERAAERPSTRGAAPAPSASSIDEEAIPTSTPVDQPRGHAPAPGREEPKRTAAKGVAEEEAGSKGDELGPGASKGQVAASKDEAQDNVEGGVPALGSEEKRSMRPRTARQRPPKVKDNVKEVDAKDAAKAAPKSSVVIMREGNDGDQSDEEAAEEEVFKPTGVRSGEGSGKTHGKLVQDIMKEQKKDDEARRKEAAEDEKKEASDGGIRLGRLGLKKDGAGKSGGKASVVFGESEIESLRTSIQIMCQSTNPLGKCMDYVHEDLAVMNKEYDRWQAEYRGKLDALEDQKRVTEEDVQALRLQLLELDEQVKEQHQKINGVKCSIAKNDDRIDQLLRMVVTVGGGK